MNLPIYVLTDSPAKLSLLNLPGTPIAISVPKLTLENIPLSDAVVVNNALGNEPWNMEKIRVLLVAYNLYKSAIANSLQNQQAFCLITPFFNNIRPTSVDIFTKDQCAAFINQFCILAEFSKTYPILVKELKDLPKELTEDSLTSLFLNTPTEEQSWDL